MKIPKQTIDRFRCMVAIEKASSYSDEDVARLYEIAITLRSEIEEAQLSEFIPFELWQLLGNIDFGAIKKEYRSWIIEDAEKALDLLDGEL